MNTTDAADAADTAEPEWETELQWAQQQARKALIASGMTDEQITADVEAEVDAYRAEQLAKQQAEERKAGLIELAALTQEIGLK